jgi:hypothetical protein
LRSEIHEVLGNRNVNDEKFQAVVLEEIASLKTQMVQVSFEGKRKSHFLNSIWHRHGWYNQLLP